MSYKLNVGYDCNLRLWKRVSSDSSWKKM